MPLYWGVVVSGAMKMNYPKMLYKGNKVKYEYSTANDAEHEDDLKDQGFADYADLGDEPAPPPHDPSNNKPSIVDGLTEALDEIDRLNQIIDAGAIENAELRAQLEVLSVSKVGSGSAAPNYSDMTSDELRALLDEKGIKYLARDSKDTLIKLLG